MRRHPIRPNRAVYLHPPGTFTLSSLAVAVAVAGMSLMVKPAWAADTQSAGQQAEAAAQNAEQNNPTEASAQETVVITGAEVDVDTQGYNNVYDQNVTNLYVDREYLERFKATNPGDVFKGMNGVYSMDTRSSQSITPNIRGISGEGRVPLTIDGTEQSTNVWQHMFGAGNRSYVDPALFRSIEVEKGPSLSRGLKSGVGGGVKIRTIDPADIIPEGDNWGIETNLRTSGNTSASRFNAEEFYGKDYQDIPGAQRLGQMGIEVPYPDARQKGSASTLNFEDHSEMLAIAARNEVADILFAQSQRTTGNYYAGERNADKYEGHDVWDNSSTDQYIPNLTKMYTAGSEVFNTASEVDTTLVKNNWYLPNEQRLGLQFMRTDMTFGETVPGDSVLYWGYREGAEQSQPDVDWSEYQFVYEKPHSELRVDSYKLSYDIKPEGSKWLNLETSLWHTKTEGVRYQSGVNPFGYSVDADTHQALKDYDFMVESFPEFADWFTEPEHDGTILRQGRQWTQHDRTGFDFSNQMRLTDTLQLTIGGGYQKEQLDEQLQASAASAIFAAPGGADLHISTDRLGPRSGTRKETSAMFNLAWQPTNWLTLTAGTRYLHYKGKDTGTAERRRQQQGFFEAKRRKTGVELEWGELLTAEEMETRLQLVQRHDDAYFAAEPFFDTWNTTGVKTPEIDSWLAVRDEFEAWLDGRTMDIGSRYPYWEKSTVVPLVDGKLDSSQNPFANGEVDNSLLYEVVDNAVDKMGNPTGNSVPRIMPLDATGTAVYETLAAGQAWEAPEEQSGDAFSPVLSATARITPYGTAFVRYAQTTRFPSIQELTSSAIVAGAGTVGTLATGASKPERSTNWELGYSHDITQFMPGLRAADVRLSYFNTEIEDYIDRSRGMEIIQFDQKKTSGIELQSRFDTGRYFGSLGATYRLNQKLCDQDYASSLDPFFNRIPECMTGGFPGTYSGSSLQPKLSIDMALGTRLLNNRLELGWRGTYHAGAENKELDRLLASEEGASITRYVPRDMWDRAGGDTSFYTFYWESVMLHDLYANYEVNPAVAFNLGVTNVTDEYYLDPMAKTLLPGPGRTLSAGLKVKF